jgi:hypothetical protein
MAARSKRRSSATPAQITTPQKTTVEMLITSHPHQPIEPSQYIIVPAPCLVVSTSRCSPARTVVWGRTWVAALEATLELTRHVWEPSLGTCAT